MDFLRRYTHEFMFSLFSITAFSSLVGVAEGLHIGIRAFMILSGLMLVLFLVFASMSWAAGKIDEHSKKNIL